MIFPSLTFVALALSTFSVNSSVIKRDASVSISAEASLLNSAVAYMICLIVRDTYAAAIALGSAKGYPACAAYDSQQPGYISNPVAEPTQYYTTASTSYAMGLVIPTTTSTSTSYAMGLVTPTTTSTSSSTSYYMGLIIPTTTSTSTSYYLGFIIPTIIPTTASALGFITPVATLATYTLVTSFLPTVTTSSGMIVIVKATSL